MLSAGSNLAPPRCAKGGFRADEIAQMRSYIRFVDHRSLTPAERELARSVFHDAIDLDEVRLYRRKWWPFQPRTVTMAPQGAIHFHPQGTLYCDCFAHGSIAHQGHLIHELTHVWQHQRGINLFLRRHPFCRYRYAFEPGRMFDRYGIEQQAEIVRHVFLMRRGAVVPGAPPLAMLEGILPFTSE